MEFPADIRDYRPDSFTEIKDVIIDRKGIFKYVQIEITCSVTK